MPLPLSQTAARWRAALAGERPVTGMWVASGSPVVAEICAGSGVDWLLIDGEHAPNDLHSILAQLQAVAPYPVTPVVRPPVGDPVLIKQLLDLGVEVLLIPMVESAAQARALVAATRYPPDGIRGVGSALARASRWNRVGGYLKGAAETVSLLVQIESRAGLEALPEIAAVDGIDGIFLGPADLAASLGHLGEQAHPEVTGAVEDAIKAITAAGKAAGVNAFPRDLAERYLTAGARFILVGADVTLLAVGSEELAARHRPQDLFTGKEQGGSMRQVSMQIGAERRLGTATFESVDPYTGEPWAVLPEATKADVDDAVRAARAAFDGEWTAMTGAARGRLIRRLGELITSHADDLADAETRDNGKLLREMGGQVRSLPAWYEYYAGLADKIDGRVVDTGRGDFFGYVSREPVGVVAAILPWNSPLLLLTFKLAPALAAGCTMVAKPSEQASVSIMLLAELFEQAGFPPGVFNTVSGASRQVGEWLVANPDVDHVSFTGSEVTGAAVARSAAGHLAPATLELGGKSANIVFPDADLTAAANGLVAGIFAAAGQTCIAGSRGLVHEDVYDEILERVAERASRIVMGDPKLPETEMGPICFPGQHQKIQKMVREARDSGARIVTGGDDRELGGLFYAPTIVADVSNDALICQEEVFGPVLSLLKFGSEEEAVAIANDSRYGLAAGIWTRDIQRAFRVTKRLRVGTVWVNAYRTLNFAMPFGGVKASGFGRENGTEGLHEYLRDKAVWIELTGGTRDPFVLG